VKKSELKTLIREVLQQYYNISRKTLNEYDGQAIIGYFDKLKKLLAAKNIDYSEFKEVLKSGVKTGEKYAKELRSRGDNAKLTPEQIAEFKEAFLKEGDWDYYEVNDYDEETIGYMLSVYISWLNVKEDLENRRSSAMGDMDAMSRLDEHPGTGFWKFLEELS